MSSRRSRRLSQSSKHSTGSNHLGPVPVLTPDNAEQGLQASATTEQFLLIGQGRQVIVLRHGTLAIERRIDKHTEDVVWISVDNASERGSGKLAVSYDTSNTAIIWDIQTGDEIARFVAYDTIVVAAWMRNGDVVFGNSTGNIIHFDPLTSEHRSARTIFDPITAIAPYIDCRTYAVGYMNGSIMIISVHPTFTIHHTLTTQRRPSPVATIAWHSGAGRNKTDMLATQTADGDLRVWNVPKADGKSHQCLAIRIMSLDQGIVSGPNWFGWSRNGRIVQHTDRRTRLYDMRTKQVVVQPLNVLDGLTGICNFSPASLMFTVHSNWTIQQWDLNPDGEAYVVKSVQHIPANTPPSPPGSRNGSKITAHPPGQAMISDSEASEQEKTSMSTMQRIARVKDKSDEERERRDLLAPLSPGSSRSSNSSRSSGGRRLPNYLYDRPSSRTSSKSRDSGTNFSVSQSRHREGTSVRSSTSYRSSALGKDLMRSPDDPILPEMLDLFPVTRARLQNVIFEAPNYGEATRTPAMLRKEMLRVVFGWQDDVQSLIRDEMSRQPSGSRRAILLAKWLGELGGESLISMMGSDSMRSSDWMLLALGSIGNDSQKKVGETFVQRLLEKGNIHPAVAILLGLGNFDSAIETYVSQKCYMEALLLACLFLPADWDLHCFLLRKWGEVAVTTGSPELAVRIFSCTSEETTGTWSSANAQHAVYNTRKRQSQGTASMSSPNSPLLSDRPSKFSTTNASLKLITSFNQQTEGAPAKPEDMTPINSLVAGVTPINQSALSPAGQNIWLKDTSKERDSTSTRSAISARTATPGGTGRKRMPSGDAKLKTLQDTPQTATRDFIKSTATNESSSDTFKSHRRRASLGGDGVPETLNSARYLPGQRKAGDYGQLPSPAAVVFHKLKEEDHVRNGSRTRMPDGLEVKVYQTFDGDIISPGPRTRATSRSGRSMSSGLTGLGGTVSPPLTATSTTSSRKGRARDHYISSVEQARITARAQRERSKARAESKSQRSTARSESRGRHEVKHIHPAKQSPSSPVPVSPEEVFIATRAARKAASQVTSPVKGNRPREQSRQSTRMSEIADTPASSSITRGRNEMKQEGATNRSPSAPSSKITDSTETSSNECDRPILRQRSSSVQGLAPSNLTGRTATIDNDRVSREDSGLGFPSAAEMKSILRRKELAAKELEERRLSLARRPSAPAIPLPGGATRRPNIAPRYHTELGESPTSFLSHGIGLDRSQSIWAGDLTRPLPSSVALGLPATPKVTMHPRYLAAAREEAPNAPQTHSELDRSQEDQLSPLLLTSMTYLPPKYLPRSSSAPLEMNLEDRLANRSAEAPIHAPSATSSKRLATKAHNRSLTHDGPIVGAAKQRSPSIITASIDETIASNSVSIANILPPLLPELQHLACPPPPPPIPLPPRTSEDSVRHSPHEGYSSAGTIDVALDHSTWTSPAPQLSAQMTGRAATSSPSTQHHRGRLSISDNAAPNARSFTTRIRNVTERMRSTSRSNNKSPPQVSSPISTPTATPYETVLPPFPGHAAPHTTPGHGRRESLNSTRQASTRSPFETHVRPGAMSNGATLLTEHGQPPWDRPGTAPPLDGSREDGSRDGYDPALGQRKGSIGSPGPGYVRLPKEIRANMPPELLHQGVLVPPAAWSREREESVLPGGKSRKGSMSTSTGGPVGGVDGGMI